MSLFPILSKLSLTSLQLSSSLQTVMLFTRQIPLRFLHHNNIKINSLNKINSSLNVFILTNLSKSKSLSISQRAAHIAIAFSLSNLYRYFLLSVLDCQYLFSPSNRCILELFCQFHRCSMLRKIKKRKRHQKLRYQEKKIINPPPSGSKENQNCKQKLDSG